MSAQLLPVWHEIEKYIEWGISVVPVRDKDDSYGKAKTPYGSWKQYQSVRYEKEALFNDMDVKYNTIAVGTMGGKISGNLEIIDIDVKYKPGIDAVLFTDLKTLYPDLLARLRIHKSPSGGYHILYRCEEPVPGNQKLAGREKSPEELEIEPRPKTVNFLETRGEGGYVCAPPALGYKVVKDVPIPTITAAERESIIALCRSYNEIIKIETPPKPTQAHTEYYDTNPFDDFNYRVDPTVLATDLGWKFLKSNNHFIWYTRPGKTKGVSMSFNLQKRFFYCFTASTELDESKGYTPSNLLAVLQFNNDKKKLYHHLVQSGYGKIKPKIEARLAKKAAINGKPLPPNVSQEAVFTHAALTATIDEQHPFGTYWIDGSEGVVIDREKLYNVADGLGFKLHAGRLIQSDGTYIEEVTDRHFFDSLKDYIHEEDADLYRDICNAYESFIERHGKFTITRLPILDNQHILSDTVDTAYKCYQNGVLVITATNTRLQPTVPLLIWKHNVQPRDYSHGEGGRYIEFLKLATDGINEYLMSIIGYLSHEYKDETAAYIIVLTEQCENPKDGGGAGKNVFSELFKYITSFVSKPGAQVKYDEKFMQSWNYQKIFCLSDVPKNFQFAFLKELSGGPGLMKKLFKDEHEIQSADMPKFLIQTNFSYEISDGGLRRRIKGIEFTDFFTKTGGIDVHFGIHFPKGWNDEDWAGFDTLMAKSIQLWLGNNRKIGNALLSDTGWVKQFEQTWGQVIYHFIKDNYEAWVEAEWVSNDEFKRQLDAYYAENNTPVTYRPSSMKINNAVKDWCEYKNVQYEPDMRRYVNTIQQRCKWFGSENSTPF